MTHKTLKAIAAALSAHIFCGRKDMHSFLTLASAISWLNFKLLRKSGWPQFQSFSLQVSQHA